LQNINVESEREFAPYLQKWGAKTRRHSFADAGGRTSHSVARDGRRVLGGCVPRSARPAM